MRPVSAGAGRWVSGPLGMLLATSGPMTLMGCEGMAGVPGWLASTARAGFDGETLVLFDVGRPRARPADPALIPPVRPARGALRQRRPRPPVRAADLGSPQVCRTACGQDAALRTVARLDGTPFPSTARLAGRWLRGRLPVLRRPHGGHGESHADRTPGPATAYCAEVVAVTYEEMGLLAEHRSPSWYDPGRFWSGDELDLAPGSRLGGEIAVTLPPAPGPPRVPAEAGRRTAWRPALRLRRRRTGA